MKRILFSFAFMLVTCLAVAESVSYEIVEYNSDTQDFTLKAFGQQPKNSVAFFVNDYGATTGNRYNQIPRNKEASLTLQGWEGCRIQSVTLSMCSNASSGQMALQVTNGEKTLFTMSASDFKSDAWYSTWVSKDLGIYVDLTKEMQEDVAIDENDVTIKIKGGTHEGSVYIHRITIDYTPAAEGTESPMGWQYTRLEKKSTINDGDVVMIYRNGSAAGDIDGMETSYYLDAVAVASTSSVYEDGVLFFTLTKNADNSWIFTDQYGRVLGATAAQHLAWDAGTTTWNITLGYDGATIQNTKNNYGTLRYNAPSGSYARFWNYTSTSLQLPYLYIRGAQNQPVVSTSLTLSETSTTVDLAATDLAVLKCTFYPSTVTDQRVVWTSNNESVLTVRDGILTPHQTGTAQVTATSRDGGSSATCTVEVTNTATAIDAITQTDEEPIATYRLNGIKTNNDATGLILQRTKSGKMIKRIK